MYPEQVFSKKLTICLETTSLQTFCYECGKEIVNQNMCCGYSGDPSQWNSSNEYPEQVFKQLFDLILESAYLYYRL